LSKPDDEELELEALQRRLDDAFETTRPRRGFEDELWQRIQQRRPFASRLRDIFSGLGDGIRGVPAVPLGALALLVIVAVGIGVIGPNLLHFNHNSYSSGGGIAPEAGGATRSTTDHYAGGLVPTPVLHPGLYDTAQPPAIGPVLGKPAPTVAPDLYFGPANLVWTGKFPTDAVSASVFVYAEPPATNSPADRSQYGSLQGVTLQIVGSVPELPREPVFILSEQTPGVPAGTDPVSAADSFLAAHNVLPPWPYNVVVTQSADAKYVIYQRAFTTQTGSLAYLVNWNGERTGQAVTIYHGERTVIGPLPLSLQSVQLPLIDNAQAAQMALSQPAAASASINPIPTVKLDHVELVYALAISGNYGFYEPAYLFSGTFSYNGQTYTKRVLVPLVVPSLRS
jgi:hypothetical protein